MSDPGGEALCISPARGRIRIMLGKSPRRCSLESYVLEAV